MKKPRKAKPEIVVKADPPKPNPHLATQPRPTQETCWHCKAPLPKNGVPFFCKPECSSEWAMAQAFILQRLKAKNGF